MGCNIVTADSQDVFEHRKLYNPVRPPNAVDLETGIIPPIFIGPPPQKGNTPQYGQYNELLFQTPLIAGQQVLDRVLTNPWTGETLECFEEAMPPPTTTRYKIEPSQLKHTNPKLISLQGNYDMNRPPQQKGDRERGRAGNRWRSPAFGDRIYADRLYGLRKNTTARVTCSTTASTFTPRRTPCLARRRPRGLWVCRTSTASTRT